MFHTLINALCQLFHSVLFEMVLIIYPYCSLTLQASTVNYTNIDM